MQSIFVRRNIFANFGLMRLSVFSLYSPWISRQVDADKLLGTLVDNKLLDTLVAVFVFDHSNTQLQLF